MSTTEESKAKIQLPRAEIQKIMKEMLDEGKYLTAADIETKTAPPKEEHHHKPEDFMPEYVEKFKCPDGNCGKVHENPRFKHAETYCSDCGHPFGTVKQAIEAPACPGCGSTRAALYIARPRPTT